MNPADLETALHNRLAVLLMNKLDDPECTAGWAQVARGFLNDNKVSGLDVETDQVAELAAKYSELRLNHG